MKLCFGPFLLAFVACITVNLPAFSQDLLVAPQASAGDKLPTLTTSQWTRLSAEGSLVGSIARPTPEGTLRNIPNFEVSLITGGKIVARVATNADGDFVFSQVAPGVYTVFASDPKSLLVFPLTVAPSDGVASEPIQLVAASPVPPERRQAMFGAVMGGGFSFAPAALNDVDLGARVVASSFDVSLRPGGLLQGQLAGVNAPVAMFDMSSMIVRAMREGVVMGEARVAPDGKFVVPGMSPGPIAFFAFGPQGFVSIGVNLVGTADISSNQAIATETFVSLRAPANSLNIELAPIADVVAGVNIPGDSSSPPVGGPFAMGPNGAGGPGAGSGSGGGSSGGGGGGGGELLGLGAAGLAAAALASDNNNGNFVPAPASPAGNTP